MPEHTITTDCVWRNWLGGTVDSLPFAAKICDINSPDGIDNGRVLKLFLYTEDGEQELAAYERGWSIYPTGKQEASDIFLKWIDGLNRPAHDFFHIREAVDLLFIGQKTGFHN